MIGEIKKTCIGEALRDVDEDDRYLRVRFEEWWQHHGLSLFDGKISKDYVLGAFGAGRLYEKDLAAQKEART